MTDTSAHDSQALPDLISAEADADRPVRWLEAVAEDGAASVPVPAAPARGVMVHLPGGVRMEVAHADQAALAAALMRALSAGAAPAPFSGGGGIAALRFQPSSLSPAPSC